MSLPSFLAEMGMSLLTLDEYRRSFSPSDRCGRIRLLSFKLVDITIHRFFWRDDPLDGYAVIDTAIVLAWHRLYGVSPTGHDQDNQLSVTFIGLEWMNVSHGSPVKYHHCSDHCHALALLVTQKESRPTQAKSSRIKRTGVLL